MTRCGKMQRLADAYTAWAIGSYHSGNMREAEIWKECADEVRRELEDMTLEELREPA